MKIDRDLMAKKSELKQFAHVYNWHNVVLRGAKTQIQSALEESASFPGMLNDREVEDLAKCLSHLAFAIEARDYAAARERWENRK